MFGLIHENAIKVGPRQWGYAFFKEYLAQHNIDYELPVTPPDAPIIHDEFKILPTQLLIVPQYDVIFEQLSGPFWEITDTDIRGSFNVVSQTIEMAKSKLKELVTSKRYNVEVSGTTVTLDDGNVVNIYTTREDRAIYLNALQLIGDTDKIVFKFKNSNFKEVTKSDLQRIVNAGMSHIQECFSWESQKYAEIDSANTIDQLKLINTKHSSEE